MSGPKLLKNVKKKKLLMSVLEIWVVMVTLGFYGKLIKEKI